MNKSDLAVATAIRLREQGIGKTVTYPKHVFHITDDEGNKKDFVIRKSDKVVNLTGSDINAVLDAAIEVILDAIKKGDTLSILGFGSLGVKYRKPRKYNDYFGTGCLIESSAAYVPHFTSGKDLKIAAKLYELSLIDEEITEDPPLEESSGRGGSE